MKRATPAILLAFLAVLPAAAAQTGTNRPVTLDEIMAAVRTVRHVNARYVEHRFLHILRSPIESRGTLHFDAPDHLTKVADPTANTTGDRLSIDGDRLTIDRGPGVAPVVTEIHEHPQIGVLVESIRATLSGDGAALQRIFEITPSGTLEHWQLVLQPRDAAERKLLQWMRVVGYNERITEIDTTDGEGDRSEMNIVEQTP